MIGRRVTFVRLACNSLLVYLECEPGDDRGHVVWLEPTWSLSSPDALVVGSRQAQVDEGPNGAEDLARVGDLIRGRLLGRRLESVRLEAPTFDIDLTFEGGYRLRTFAADAGDEDNWHVTVLKGDSVYGAPSGLSHKP